MDSHTTETLVQFCIAQRDAFDRHDWYARLAIDGEALVLAAKYLSMTSWYGHEEELEKIGAPTQASAENSIGLYRESQAIAFDLPHFSAKVRIGIAMLRPHLPTRRERRHEHTAPSDASAADQIGVSTSSR